MRLAVLGMGRMGHALAERLLGGGHTITVWNRTPHKAEDLVAKGVRSAATPAEAAQIAEATFMSLADDDAVREVVCGPFGAVAGIGDGVLVDASTVSPETSAQVARAMSGRFLAAPILGAPAAVVSGDAIYIISGRHEIYESVRPAFDALAEKGHRRLVGEDPKLAATLKLLSNYLLLSGIAILAETIAAAQAVGLADDLIIDYFGHLPLVAPALRNRLEDIVSGDHKGWFTTRLGAKDLRLAVGLARAHGVPLALAEAVKGRYEQAAAEGWADADIGAVVELVRRSQLRASPAAVGRSGAETPPQA
jgi:3-hydroxyisobutyrate dehydrogenase-like beta-hydroxyacid dehydrogenase